MMKSTWLFTALIAKTGASESSGMAIASTSPSALERELAVSIIITELDNDNPDNEGSDVGNSAIFDAERRVIATNQAMGARCAVAADFDGDGRMDIVSASSNDNAVSWFRNEGPSSNGDIDDESGIIVMPKFSIKKQITWNSLGSRIVTVADIDGDGDIDVVGASYYDSSLRWFENDGNGEFTSHLISSGVNEGQGVTVADIDNDGSPDVICASSGDNTIAVFKNIGNGTFCEIKDVVDDQAIGARTVIAADLNGDGWLDLASASKDDDTVAWYPNDGKGQFPTKMVISSGEESAGAYSLVAADVDQDGHMDLVVASNGNDHVSLWRNDGTANFSKTLIYGEADFVLSVTAIDFDRDGDIDVASASFFDGHINWYENVDGKGYEWKNHTIYVGLQGHYVSTGDLDGDGDDDLIAVMHAENTVAVFFAQTSCNNDNNTQTADCCYPGTQWNGTDCQTCEYGSYGIGSGIDAKCIECPTDVCVIPGLNVVPASCSGITGCADMEEKLAQCACEANTMKDSVSDACIPCPDGQIRPDASRLRDMNSLGNYPIWEAEQGVCFVPHGETATPTMIIGIVVAVLVASFICTFFWFQHKVKVKSLALWSVDENEIQYDDPVEVIGKGAFGEVIKGRYRGTEVAIKRALPRTDRKPNSMSSTVSEGLNAIIVDEELGKRYPMTSLRKYSLRKMGSTNTGIFGSVYSDFVSEMTQLAKLRHPNITTTMGAIVAQGKPPMLVMEFMCCGSLYDVIRNDSMELNSHEDILTIVQDVAHGLRFLHSAKPQVIHGDLKSRNVLIDSNCRAKVADFGMCTKTSSMVRGTPYWMAPELILKKSMNNSMSDVYAFGILLYEVYSRKDPYEGEYYETVIRDICDPAVAKRPPVPVLCPARIASLYKDCLEGYPEARPSAQQIDAKLQAEGTIQGRVFRIEELNRKLVESNRRTTAEQATQLAHFASMSHEIRTPLNCILGVSSLLEEDKTLESSHLELIKMIASSGKLLRHIVDDVLDFSKLISGNLEIEIKRTNLQATLNNVAASMRLSPITDRKNIRIQTFYGPNVPQYFETDERRLQQILYNLLSNAVKFSNEESTVDLSVLVVDGSLSTQCDEKKDNSAAMPKKERQKLLLSVKDYGEGIAESDYKNIFEPFQQTETGTNNVDGGTGLGLAVTKSLTELLGGSISVESKLREWTEFSVFFPITGTAVNLEFITSRVSKCCVSLITNNESDVQYTMDICRYFKIQCLRSENLKALADTLAPKGTEDVIVCLVQEDLYDLASYESVSKKIKSILVTFGPSGNIDQSQVHYQSLVQVFPSVLMRKIANLMMDRETSLPHLDSSVRTTGSSDSFSLGISLEQLKIMVVEDNKVNQKVLSRLLERLGVSVVKVVSNGKLAVDLEAQESFDVIFMDIQMPVMDGTEACKRIMARYNMNANKGDDDRNLQPPKIIFLSAHVLEDYEAMRIETGALDYMTKPCTLKDIRQKLATITGV